MRNASLKRYPSNKIRPIFEKDLIYLHGPPFSETEVSFHSSILISRGMRMNLIHTGAQSSVPCSSSAGGGGSFQKWQRSFSDRGPRNRISIFLQR